MPSKRNKNQLPVEQIFQVLQQLYPDPQTELHYRNDFQLLVAVALSAQTTDKAVNAVTADFFTKVFTPHDMLQYSIQDLEQIFRTIGLYRSKARHIHQLSEILVRDYDGQVPLEESQLRSLPGVGRKTAHVVLNCLLGAPLIAVDTHVFRVSCRLGIANSTSRDVVGDQLMACVPKQHLVQAHHYLIAHGRRVCQARKPLCADCALSSYCHYYKENSRQDKK